jgi:hypothetical protein
MFKGPKEEMIKAAIALLFFTGCTFAENENHLRDFSKKVIHAVSNLDEENLKKVLISNQDVKHLLSKNLVAPDLREGLNSLVKGVSGNKNNFYKDLISSFAKYNISKDIEIINTKAKIKKSKFSDKVMYFSRVYISFKNKGNIYELELDDGIQVNNLWKLIDISSKINLIKR